MADIKQRITPAYAGKSVLCSSGFSRKWDHPRVCGEKIGIKRQRANELGSPPRMRGKEYPANSHQPKHRITPAYAGKSRIIW